MAFFGAIPFVLEVSVLAMAFTRYHVVDQVEEIQRTMEEQARERYQAKIKAEQERYQLKTPAAPAPLTPKSVPDKKAEDAKKPLDKPAEAVAAPAAAPK